MSKADLWAGEPVQLESVACNFCGSTESRIELQALDYAYHVPGLFSIVRCTNCGLAYENPRPRQDQFNRLYPHEYGPHRDVRTSDDVPPLVRWSRMIERVAASRYYERFAPDRKSSRMRLVPSPWVLLAKALQLAVLPPKPSDLGEPGRVLDIGCSTGRFLSRMKAEGWQVQGVEPDREAATLAVTKFGVPVANEAFGPGLFEPGSFDLVTMWHVLEHLPDPMASLREAAILLKPGGWLVAQVPNLESAEVWLTRNKAAQLDLPRHLYHFGARTLSAMLKEAGLSLHRVVYPIEPTLFYTSLARKMGVTTVNNSGRGQTWRLRLLWPLCAIFSWLGAGEQVAALAQKPTARG